jgi:drug/metabolite transporter (DMT)-like permease
MIVIVKNFDLKKVVYDCVNRENVWSLVFRTVQGGLGIYCSFTTLEKFNVSTTGIVCSLMPLLVLLFAACLLGEQVSKKDFLLLVCVFTAVVLVLIGA